jgi:hypothetical protein
VSRSPAAILTCPSALPYIGGTTMTLYMESSPLLL